MQIGDPEGRFILVTGLIFGQHITMLNDYAPNKDCPTFTSKMILLPGPFERSNLLTYVLTYRSRLSDIKIITKLHLEYYLCTMHIS